MPDTRPDSAHEPDSRAAGTGDRPTGDVSRQRLRDALRKPSRAQAIVGVLLAALGFAVVTQVRATTVDESFAGYTEQDLIDVLDGLAGTNQRSQSEIARLETTRDRLESRSSQRRTALEEARSASEDLAILAGLVPVTGPGIRVSIREVDGRASLGSMLDLVQELRTVGAEAIELNNEVRLVAQSSIEESADGLVVDGVQLAAPYTLDAIGDPDLLSGAVSFADGPRTQFENDGSAVTVEELTSLDVLSVRGEDDPLVGTLGPGGSGSGSGPGSGSDAERSGAER